MKLHFLAYIISLAALVGCTREPMTTPDTPPTPCTKAEFITLASPKLQDTKGTPIDGVDNLLNFYFTAVSHNSEWALANDDATKKRVVDNKEVTKDDSEKWVYSPVAYWPNGTTVSAFGYSLLTYGKDGNGAIPADEYSEYGLTVDNSDITPKITYQVPTNVTKQPDLVVAAKINNTQDTSARGISLDFKHALASIGFSGVSPHLLRSVESITISNVCDKGTLMLGRSESAFTSEIKWKLESSSTTAAPLIDHMKFLPSTVNNGTDELYSLMKGDGYLMMLPQTLAAGAKITIKFNTGIEKVFDIKNTVWEAGKKYIYQFRVGALTTYYEKYKGGGLGLYFYEYYLDEGVQKTKLVNTIREGETPIEAGYGFLSRSGDFKGDITWSDVPSDKRKLTAPVPELTEQETREEPKEKYYLYRLDQSANSILPLIDEVSNLATDSDNYKYYGATKPQVLKIDGVECEGYCLPHFAKGVYTTTDVQKEFEIRTPQQMQNISFNAAKMDYPNSTLSKTYYQKLDLDFSSSSIGGVPVLSAVVKGTFYGTYKNSTAKAIATIDKVRVNFEITAGGNNGTYNYLAWGWLKAINVGLFQNYSDLSGGTFENFTLQNSEINLTRVIPNDVGISHNMVVVAGFAAYCDAHLKNLTVKNTIINNDGIRLNSTSTWLRATGGIAGLYNNEIETPKTVTNCDNIIGDETIGKNGKVIGSGFVGGIIGGTDNVIPSLISECDNSSPVIRIYDTSGGAIGGIIGKYGSTASSAIGEIRNCHNTANITSSEGNYVGGIIGHLNVPNLPSTNPIAVVYCINEGEIKGKIGEKDSTSDYFGGIVGQNNKASLKDCINTGNISSEAKNTGGVVGNSLGDITKCKNTGTISSSKYAVGGIVGSNGEKNMDRPTVSECTNSGEVEGGAESFNVGGIAGESYGTITRCNNSNDVICKRNGYLDTDTNGNKNPIWTGGIVGNNIDGATVSLCENSANVKGQGSVFGGIAGVNFGAVDNCTNNSFIGFRDDELSEDKYKYSKSVGGIVGENSATTGTITNCLNKGGVTTTNRNIPAAGGKEADITSDVGGIAGTNRNYIGSCVNTGNIKGTGSNAGGIAGSNLRPDKIGIENCASYNNSVTALTVVGGVVGKNLYYISDVMYADNPNNTPTLKINSTESTPNYCGGIVGSNEPNYSDKPGAKTIRAIFIGVVPQRADGKDVNGTDKSVPIAGNYEQASRVNGNKTETGINTAINGNGYSVYDCKYLNTSSTENSIFQGYLASGGLNGYSAGTSILEQTAEQLNAIGWTTASKWEENWNKEANASTFPYLYPKGAKLP